MSSRIRDWLTTSEVGAQFGVTSQTVRWWVMTGKLKGEVAGRNTYLVHVSAIERFKADRHNRDTQPAARGGEASSQRSVRKPIDPGKRYRLKTGEVVTGAELLRRRAEA